LIRFFLDTNKIGMTNQLFHQLTQIDVFSFPLIFLCLSIPLPLCVSLVFVSNSSFDFSICLYTMSSFICLSVG
jgi:hypothetical protein